MCPVDFDKIHRDGSKSIDSSSAKTRKPSSSSVGLGVRAAYADSVQAGYDKANEEAIAAKKRERERYNNADVVGKAKMIAKRVVKAIK